jgi:glycosyltransferase involved in cell wall biosynthesis
MIKKVTSKLFRICVITHPFSKISTGPGIILTFLKILSPLSDEIYLITGNFPEKKLENISVKDIRYKDKRERILINFFRYSLIQMKTSYNLLKLHNNVDYVIFFMGSMHLLLPILLTKFLRKKLIVMVVGSDSKTAIETYNEALFGFGGIIFSVIFRIKELIIFFLADKLITESENVVNFVGLDKYRKKVSTNGALYKDIDFYKIAKDLKDRTNLIGYIGSLSKIKGVMNFVSAIPLILKEKGDLQFLIGGGGPLFDVLKYEIENNKLYDKVELTNWIPNGELPDYLNELKLLVLPSYGEGLPNIVLEAMACGTPVLATPVGGIPDVIEDGETGFLLEDNSPECIAKNIFRALEHPNLNRIVKNARKLVEDEYSYEKAVERYRKILKDF